MASSCWRQVLLAFSITFDITVDRVNALYMEDQNGNSKEKEMQTKTKSKERRKRVVRYTLLEKLEHKMQKLENI